MEAVFSFTRYGVCVTLSLLAGLAAALAYQYRARRYSLEVMLTFCVITVPCVWLASRLVFAAANASYYITTLSRPSLALRFWDGGYSMSGAILGACAGAAVSGRLMRVSPRVMLDSVGFGFPVAVLFARLSEIGTGLGEGREVTGWIPPLAPEGYDGYLHPVFLYEAAAALVLFLILIALVRSHHLLPHEGDLLLLALLLYGTFQSFLESLRDDGHMVVHFVRIQQILAIAMVFFCLAVFARRARSRTRSVIVCVGISLAALALAVASEFGVDRWGNRLLAYALMLLCLAAILISSLHLYHLTFREGIQHGARKD